MKVGLTTPANYAATMKKLLMLVALLATTLTLAQAQDVKDNAKETGRQAKRTMNAAGNKMDREAKDAKQDVKDEAHDAKVKTKRGANKAMDKMDHGMKKAEKKMNSSK